MNIFLRPKGFGKESLKGIASFMENDVAIVRSDKPLYIGQDDTVIRWGCTKSILFGQEINTADEIHSVSDKATSRKRLSALHLAPPTLDDGTGRELRYPVIVRPSKHKQGKNIHKCDNLSEVIGAVQKYPDGFYVSEYVDKVKEFRVIVAQGRAVLSYEKIPEDSTQLAWNHAQGATTPNTKWGSWDLNVIQAAILAVDEFGLDFGAVDVMVNADGCAYILEINTAPETTSEYRQKCFAKVFDYMINNGTDIIPVDDGVSSWKQLIHPAISDKAI